MVAVVGFVVAVVVVVAVVGAAVALLTNFRHGNVFVSNHFHRPVCQFIFGL